MVNLKLIINEVFLRYQWGIQDSGFRSNGFIFEKSKLRQNVTAWHPFFYLQATLSFRLNPYDSFPNGLQVNIYISKLNIHNSKMISPTGIG